MSGRQSTFDVVGPFGSPDGSRAELDDMLVDFVEFDGDPGFGGLATRADDSKVRVIAGKLGSGKTVYMRRLQDYQAHQESVYAHLPEHDPPKTEVIVTACQWFSGQVLVEKWMQIWDRAIIRSLVSHLLLHRELRHHVTEEHRDEIERDYGRLLGEVRRPRDIYAELSNIVHERHTAHQLSSYLDDPLWEDLKDLLGEVLAHTKPVYFYLDAVDEEFGHAPMYWLRCQEGLFYQVMRLLRDPRLGGRLHVVVSIRDIVMSAVHRSEHAPRYQNEPHIRLLSWDSEALLHLLRQKLERLPRSSLMRHPSNGTTVRDWLGVTSLTDEWGAKERVEDHLIRHTRMIPRDVISLGNALAREILRQRKAGRDRLPDIVLRDVVARCAKQFGDSQLAQCANQISSDLMPATAGRYDFTGVYTGDQAYIGGIIEQMRSLIRLMKVDQFPRSDLDGLREIANPYFESATDIASVLWQNGLLGYVDERGTRRFYSLGDIEEFALPPEVDMYVIHPSLARSVGLASVRSASGAATP
jgi:hypothetical protein